MFASVFEDIFMKLSVRKQNNQLVSKLGQYYQENERKSEVA